MMSGYPAGPHWYSEGSIRALFWFRGFAILPLVLAKAFGNGFYGIGSFFFALALFAAFGFIADKAFKKPARFKEGIFFDEAVLFLLLVPEFSPALLIIGALISVFLCRKIFGGAGFSICHPVLVSVAFLDLISEPGLFLKSGLENVPTPFLAGSIGVVLIIALRIKMVTREAVLFLAVFFITTLASSQEIVFDNAALWITATIFILADKQYLPLVPGRGWGLIGLAGGIAAALASILGPLRAVIYSGLFLNLASIWLEYHAVGRKQRKVEK